MVMDVDAYLDRIGLAARPRPTLEGLRVLHRAHLRAVPYENLDVQLGRPVTIERPAIFKKIVEGRRGGWCYEMNGIFGWALGELGFAVTRATGAVTMGGPREDAAGNHLVIRVDLDEGRHLADVGLSHGPLDPIPIAAGAFEAGGAKYRVEEAEDGWWRFFNHDLAFPPSFDFDLGPADEALLAARCSELQTSADSIFVQNLICSRFGEDAVFVLLGRVLRTVTLTARDDRVLGSEDEFMEVLRNQIGLDAPEAASLWPKICERHEAVLARNAEAAAAAP
jgi:N-hydroxyarylamine O-acetyltransferase